MQECKYKFFQKVFQAVCLFPTDNSHNHETHKKIGLQNVCNTLQIMQIHKKVKLENI